MFAGEVGVVKDGDAEVFFVYIFGVECLVKFCGGSCGI